MKVSFNNAYGLMLCLGVIGGALSSCNSSPVERAKTELKTAKEQLEKDSVEFYNSDLSEAQNRLDSLLDIKREYLTGKPKPVLPKNADAIDSLKWQMAKNRYLMDAINEHMRMPLINDDERFTKLEEDISQARRNVLVAEGIRYDMSKRNVKRAEENLELEKYRKNLLDEKMH